MIGNTAIPPSSKENTMAKPDRSNDLQQLRDQRQQALERGDTAEADRLQQQITQSEQQAQQQGTAEL
jgi:hypothetical protein